MTKRSGYSVKINCFIEASPTNMDEMRLAISAIDAACEALRKDGFQMVTHETRFMLSKDVTEPPSDEKAAQAVPLLNNAPDISESTLEIPPQLDRRKA